MRNFKKKAIFAALMGVISPISTFAGNANAGNANAENANAGNANAGNANAENANAENANAGNANAGNANAGNAKTVDNGDLYKSNIKKRCKLLNIKDYNLNNPEDKAKLKEVFKQISTIYYENFGGRWKEPLNPDVIENQRRMQINNKKIIKILNMENVDETDKYIPKRGAVNPIYNLEDEPTKQKLINSKAKTDFEKFTSAAGNGRFLVHTNKNGTVDGFVDLTLQSNNGIEINFLATKADKLHQGIGGTMIKELQKKYNYIELLPSNQNSADFYAHFGFTHTSRGMTWNRIQRQ